MKQQKYVKDLSKHEMRLFTKMRGINDKKSTSKIRLLRILKKRRQNNLQRIPI